MNSKNILITGGSGLIGTRLTELLIQSGFRVTHLTRSRSPDAIVRTFLWDVNQSWIEPGFLNDVDCIVHLAGAGIADKPWDEERKQEIIDSRVKSTALLRDELDKAKHSVKTFIVASGIGYYGSSTTATFTESDPPGNDFVANVARLWEGEVERISSPSIRVVKLRTATVLSDKGGALDEFVKPIKWYVGAPLGTGNQWMTWIHIDDLCAMYIFAIENKTVNGSYNALAPEMVTNRTFMKATAAAMGKPLIFPPIPTWVLKLLLGEMAYIVVEGNRASPAKIQAAGFKFQFEKIDDALRDLL